MVIESQSWPDAALQRIQVLGSHYLSQQKDSEAYFIDVGVHYGETFQSLEKFPCSKVVNYIGLEPDPRNYYKAQANVLNTNSNFRSVKLLNYCAGPEIANVQFNQCKSDVVSGVLQSDSCLRERVPDGDHDTIQAIGVLQTTIDHIFEDSNISSSSHNILKIDTEGYDLQVLLGAKNSLENHYVDIIISEFFCVRYREGQSYLWECMNYLSSLGYLFDNFYDSRNTCQGRLYTGNIVFVSPRIAHLNNFA